MCSISCPTHRLNRTPSILFAPSLAMLLLAFPNIAAASNFVWQGSCLPNGWNDRCYVGPCSPPPGDLYVNNWGYSACSADPALPGIGDDVYIASPFTVTFGGIGAARNLTCDGFLDSYATLSLGQSATINGQLRFSGGAVIGPASVTISPGAFLDVRTGEELRQITFTNRGYAFQATDRSSQFLTNGSRFYNEGTFELQSWGAIAGDAHPDNAVVNSGVIRQASPSFLCEFSGVQFFNSGLVDVQAGTMILRGGSSAGQFHVAQGATLGFQYGSISGGGYILAHTFLPGTTFTGPGLVQMGNGTCEIVSSMTIPNLDLAGGSVINHGVLTCSNHLQLDGGGLAGGGTILIPPGAHAADQRGGGDLGSQTIINEGTTTIASTFGTNAHAGFLFENRGQFVLNCGGWGCNDPSLMPRIVNTGVVTKTTVGDAGFSNTVFENAGIVDVQQGNLWITPFVQTAGSTLLAPNTVLSAHNYSAIRIEGGVFGGSGCIPHGWLENVGGVIEPGRPIGTLQCNQGFVQGPAGTLHVEIEGTQPGQCDVIDCFDFAVVTLDGTLFISLGNGFTPQPGDTFVVMRYRGRTGQFARVITSTAACAAQVGFDLVYNQFDLTLVVKNYTPCLHPGDLNGNGTCDLPDVAMLVPLLLGANGAYDACADMNNDCRIDGDDVQVFLNFLL